jgi:predicted transcriptional regulator
MKQEGKEVEAIGENSINFCTKVTRKISEPEKLLNSIIYNSDKINDLVAEFDINDVKNNYFEKVYNVKDKEKVLEIVNTFQSVEGKLLEGVEDKITEYLTVK